MINALKGGQPQPDAMPFGVGGPAEPMQSVEPIATPLAGHLANKVMDVPKHLIDSAAQFDSNDIHGSTARVVPAATEAAMALMGRGVAAPTAGAAGIFGGKLAKTANLDKLAQAERMIGKNQDRGMVRQLTGWHQGPDGEFRFEIPDEHSRMMYPQAQGPAGTLFQHQPLYQAYPALRDIPMASEINKHFPDNTGSWNLGTGLLQLSSQNKHQANLGAVHEMQHAVQNIEGFTPGTTVGAYEEMFKQHPELAAQVHPKEPFDLYHATAGEVEARNAEARRAFDPQMRQVIHPWESQDTPYHEQLKVPAFTDSEMPILKALRGQK